MEEWQKELRGRICGLEELESELELEGAERDWFLHGDTDPAARLPFAVTRYYLSLMDDSPGHPLRRQAIPRIDEFRTLPGESLDPLCEGMHSPLPRLVHRYADRVLFLAAGSCALYCRHCFRRHFTGEGDGSVMLEAAEKAAAYLEEQREVRELLISGGDPLILPDTTIRKMLALFRTARPDIIIRIGTRMPVVLPSRITEELAALLGSFAPLFVITQFNHPLELAAPARAAAARLSNAGVVLLNQSVLLRGVNDSEETIRRLSGELLSARIIPYYLFQGDLASGTAHLRAPMSRGISIMRSLRQNMSGLATPSYAVDLPGGGGKWLIPLEPPPERSEGFYRISGPGGRIWLYPDED